MAANDLVAGMTAALAWWREAGVDCGFADTPQQWIAAPAMETPDAGRGDRTSFPAIAHSPPASAPAGPRAMIGGDRSAWPGELTAFCAWWLREPSLDQGQSRGRVAPRGPFAAPLMVLVPEPEADDRDMLLSGPQGRLLGAMLAAMGLPLDQVYVASALPRHTPMADWPGLTARGLGEVLRHHLALARPQRVIAFGRHIPPLLARAGLESPLAGTGSTQTVPFLPYVSHDGHSVPLLVARDLGALLERPIAKGNFWQHWLEWSAA